MRRRFMAWTVGTRTLVSISSSSSGVPSGAGRVGAHAAGVGAGVAVEGALVVLRRRQRHDGPAGDQGQDAQLLAFEPLLDDDLPAGGAAELLAHHDAVDGGEGLLAACCRR